MGKLSHILLLTHGLLSCGLPFASHSKSSPSSVSPEFLRFCVGPSVPPTSLSLGICRLDSWERASTGVGSPSSQVAESPVRDSFYPLYVSCRFLSISHLCSSHEGVEEGNIIILLLEAELRIHSLNFIYMMSDCTVGKFLLELF